jgi:hypothetical protein
MAGDMIIEDTAHTSAKRPQSLRQAAAFGLEFGDRDAFPREFLDEFYVEGKADRRAAMLMDEPPMSRTTAPMPIMPPWRST